MKQRGFSLIELLVSVGILTLINIMIFASYPEFSQRMALKRTSEEIALIVRQAQVYALGIKRSFSVLEDDYLDIGVHFDENDSKSLILFADENKDENYDVGGGCGEAGAECFQEFKIDTGDYVSELQVCDSTSCQSVKSGGLDIIYPRAMSMAKITANSGITNPSSANVTIKSPRGKERLIKIWVSGEISIKE